MEKNIHNISNPLLCKRETPYGTFPFDKITPKHIEEAIYEGMARENDEIRAITENSEAPTFKNTILALESSGALLNEASTLMYNLQGVTSNKPLDELIERLAPVIARHETDILLNERLFMRVKAVMESCCLVTEERKLLEETYDAFLRSGATLSPKGKERFRAITAELSELSVRFSQNNLKERDAYELLLTDEKDLDGLPASLVVQAAQLAKEKSKEGWIITLQAPLYRPFMMYSHRRELRKRLYLAYNTLCTHDNEYNNFNIVRRLVNLRMERAHLLGYKTYADFVLKHRMAGNTERVYSLLNQLIESYKQPAESELKEVEALARELEGEDFQMEPWDFSYYSHLLKVRLYDVDEEKLRPYFELSQVKNGIFGLANRLYGITFRERKDIPVYHPDVTAYEVLDADGSFLAVFYADLYAREGKQGGAWMTNYKEQWIDDNGANSRPHVAIATNFPRPLPGHPSLLNLDEVETFLHEFGHALHGMFSKVRFRSLSGTNVYWDFVELPSQFMENYATEKDFLCTFARHYQTGENLSDEWVSRIVRSRNYNVAYACMRQVSFGLLDMAYYTLEAPLSEDIRTFEQRAWRQAVLIPAPDEACMSVQFGHIMSGGYAAGYYSYKWAEVLDADAFSLFKENGIFDRETATRFRSIILSQGGTEDPMTLFVKFRGREPDIHALLVRNGLEESAVPSPEANN